MTAALESCVFCRTQSNAILFENDLAFAILDQFPVTPQHVLVISKRHIPDYFSLTEPELLACNELLSTLCAKILAEDQSVKGFNIGINAGTVAGQTIFHCHIHLIPRRRGDVANPRGGVRHLITGKGNY
jgi:diadenosine tetraphosphate (Ap4A) HIT family hydrolase